MLSVTLGGGSISHGRVCGDFEAACADDSVQRHSSSMIALDEVDDVGIRSTQGDLRPTRHKD